MRDLLLNLDFQTTLVARCPAKPARFRARAKTLHILPIKVDMSRSLVQCTFSRKIEMKVNIRKRARLFRVLAPKCRDRPIKQLIR